MEEPDGEYFTRDAIQQFVQEKENPAHLINHDNEYLHYKYDWYIVDYEYDDNNNKDEVPPVAFVYYRGTNDAWDGYGGVFMYTRDAELPESLIPRLRIAANKVGFDFDKDFTVTDNTCTAIAGRNALVLHQKFDGKILLNTEESVRTQDIRQAQKVFSRTKAMLLRRRLTISQIVCSSSRRKEQQLTSSNQQSDCMFCLSTDSSKHLGDGNTTQ